jgi:hypothetical protein
MIKIVRATYLRDQLIHLEFSDKTAGDCDLAPLISRESPLTAPLRDSARFKEFFLEVGSLEWPNGLSLDAEALHENLKAAGLLKPATSAAA